MVRTPVVCDFLCVLFVSSDVCVAPRYINVSAVVHIHRKMRTESCECNGCMRNAGYHIPEPANSAMGDSTKQVNKTLYMGNFNQTQLDVTYDDKFRRDDHCRYVVPQPWQNGMKLALEMGFDDKMLQTMLAFHRAQIRNLTASILLQLAEDEEKSQKAPRLLPLSTFGAAQDTSPQAARAFDFDWFQTKCKNREAHRTAAVMIQAHLVAMQKAYVEV